jgi:hypothetical protein
MMANTQDLQDKITKNTLDLQDQLLQNDLKLTTEIQCIKQDHDAFNQEIRDELLRLYSGGPLSRNFLINNIASSSQTVPTIAPPVVAFNPALISMVLPQTLLPDPLVMMFFSRRCFSC